MRFSTHDAEDPSHGCFPCAPLLHQVGGFGQNPCVCWSPTSRIGGRNAVTDRPNRIRCTITNCHYHAKDNACNASEILVTSGEMANALPDTIDAPMAAQVSETPVAHGTDSCCKTFVRKDAYEATLDVVHNQ